MHSERLLLSTLEIKFVDIERCESRLQAAVHASPSRLKAGLRNSR